MTILLPIDFLFFLLSFLFACSFQLCQAKGGKRKEKEENKSWQERLVRANIGPPADISHKARLIFISFWISRWALWKIDVSQAFVVLAVVYGRPSINFYSWPPCLSRWMVFFSLSQLFLFILIAARKEKRKPKFTEAYGKDTIRPAPQTKRQRLATRNRYAR